ncbi:MAG: hypothetical protein KME13_24265 [Myxacorys californica WJT36-NPBG1]|jgi:hypothetical protein|nr:hypothetical protein [Myxacorys californica WJT36-NPBG1]
MNIPGLRVRHLLIMIGCAYILQAIATADGAFRLNHSLLSAIKDNGAAGWQRSLIWLDKSADSLDKWSIDRFGKDPWIANGEMLAQYTSDCVTSPSNGKGYLSTEKIKVFRNAKKKDLRTLGMPLCKTITGDLRYTTSTPGTFFHVNPNNLNQNGSVRAND